MANMLEKLTEGVVLRNRQAEVAPLVEKWAKYGLLEGLKSENDRSNMAVILENQAKELLREATNSLADNGIQGFAAVAFPLVRRVFGSLIANDLVSVQPMSLPSGLVFFLDFTRVTQIGMTGSEVYKAGESIYGGDRVGADITKGVLLAGQDAANRGRVELGLMSIAHGYHKARGYQMVAVNAAGLVATDIAFNSAADLADASKLSKIRYDADLLALSGTAAGVKVVDIPLNSTLFPLHYDRINEQNVFAISAVSASSDFGNGTSVEEPSAGIVSALPVVRRLCSVFRSTSDVRTLRLVLANYSGATVNTGSVNSANKIGLSYPVTDSVTAPAAEVIEPGTGLGVLTNTSVLEGTTSFPELRINVSSLSITTEARKLKASWTPELSQDLNAYHNLDAEVELTNLLSEQISQEIDQMLLNDLVKGATAGTYYWSRRPGKFVNRLTGGDIGADLGSYAAPPDFTGNVSMWYETLIETINDVSAQIMRKTLRGGATFLVTSPEVANILEMTAGFRASVSHGDEKGSVGVVNVGSISKKWDVMVSVYFPRNLILVGRKGSGFLESGYVYAPYVPLQMTPTIFGQDDFTPRKAVMTRFGRKMVRPDMYGLVVVTDLLG